MSGSPAGYRKRPWELTLLAAFFALVPFLSWLTRGLSLAAAGQPEPPLDSLASFFLAAGNGPVGLVHSLLMGTLWVLFLVVAWGIFKVARWGFFLCIAAAIANSLFSLVSYSVTEGTSGLEETLSFQLIQVGFVLNLVFFVPVVLLLNQKIMAPFFNPRLKWWEQHPRVKALLRIEATIAGEKKRYRSFDLSASGLFLGTEETPPVSLGQTFPAQIHLEESGTVVEVVCQVVWISDGKGRAPVGCGVTFSQLPGAQKRVLSRYIRSKIKQGHRLERT